MKRRGPAFRAAQLENSMYDRIDDRSAQQAVRAKMEAAAQQDRMGASISGIVGLQQGPGTPAAVPLMDQEYQRLCEAISGLDTAVIDLLERISPVLQPGLGKDAEEAAAVACALDCSCGNGIDVLVLVEKSNLADLCETSAEGWRETALYGAKRIQMLIEALTQERQP